MRLEGQGLVGEDAKDGLIPAFVATRDDVNAAEQRNITKALVTLRHRRLSTATILDDTFVRSLHTMMFSEVWKWAGTYRLTERTIGWRTSIRFPTATAATRAPSPMS